MIEKKRIKKVAAINRRRIENNPHKKRVELKLPCPFLKNKKCTISNIRPLNCQGYNSLKVSDCKIENAIATVKAITFLKPKIITLENVSGYTKSDSFRYIVNALLNQQYLVNFEILNFADFGIPQTRRRLFLRAFKNSRYLLSLPTKKPQKGWWSAISDLFPTFKPTKLTNTQLSRLAKKQFSNSGKILVKRNQIRNNIETPIETRPAFTITAELCSDGKGGNRQNFVNILDTNKTVYAITIRALSRLQTVPDWYQFSGKNALDGRIIGNGIPCNFIKELFN